MGGRTEIGLWFRDVPEAPRAYLSKEHCGIPGAGQRVSAGRAALYRLGESIAACHFRDTGGRVLLRYGAEDGTAAIRTQLCRSGGHSRRRAARVFRCPPRENEYDRRVHSSGFFLFEGGCANRKQRAERLAAQEWFPAVRNRTLRA